MESWMDTAEDTVCPCVKKKMKVGKKNQARNIGLTSCKFPSDLHNFLTVKK